MKLYKILEIPMGFCYASTVSSKNAVGISKSMNAIENKLSEARSTANKIKDLIVQKLDADKAESITVIDLENKTDLAYYMVVASGKSSRNISALADNLVLELKKHLKHGVNIEGLNLGQWILVDAKYVIVHLFQPEIRTEYDLESLWQDEEK